MTEVCQCKNPEYCTTGDIERAFYCSKCMLPIRIKNVDEIMTVLNQSYYEKHKAALGEVKPELTPRQVIELEPLEIELTEKETKQAISIEESRSMLKWVQSGKLKPKSLMYAGVGMALLYAATKLYGC